MAADPLCVIGASSISKHPNAEWVIEDEVVDAEARESKRERSIKINKRFESLSISQKKDLLTALGVRLTGLEKDVIIEDLLYLKITENKSSDELLSIQDTFLELTNKESKGKLELTVKVEKMFQYAILRKENTSVYFNGEKLSTDVFNIVQFLSEPANSGIFLSLEEALTAKMKTA
jgi:predicted RNA-binding protein